MLRISTRKLPIIIIENRQFSWSRLDYYYAFVKKKNDRKNGHNRNRLRPYSNDATPHHFTVNMQSEFVARFSPRFSVFRTIWEPLAGAWSAFRSFWRLAMRFPCLARSRWQLQRERHSRWNAPERIWFCDSKLKTDNVCAIEIIQRSLN